MDLKNTITNLCEFYDETLIDKYVEEYTTFMESKGKNGLSLKKIELDMFRSEKYLNSLKPILHTNGKIVNVFMLCRDNQDTIRNTLNNLFEIEKRNPEHEFHFWILENDSEDKTPKIIKSMLKDKKGMVCTGVLGTDKWGTVKNIQRVKDMCRYRNLNRFMCEFKGVPHMTSDDLSGMYDEWNGVPCGLDGSEYCILIDTCIKFDTDIFEKMKEQLLSDERLGMVCPFGYIKGKPTKYYDTYALCQTKNNINSAFGGFALIRSCLFKVCNWEVYLPKCSEHNTFCYDIIKNGYKIKIDRNIKVEWSVH